jgi:hypothetical protein
VVVYGKNSSQSQTYFQKRFNGLEKNFAHPFFHNMLLTFELLQTLAWVDPTHVLVTKCRSINNCKKVVNIVIVTGISGNTASGFLPSSKSSSGHCQLVAIIKPSRPAQRGILCRIDLGVMDMGLFYRPIHSVKTALRRRNSCLCYPRHQTCQAPLFGSCGLGLLETTRPNTSAILAEAAVSKGQWKPSLKGPWL